MSVVGVYVAPVGHAILADLPAKVRLAAIQECRKLNQAKAIILHLAADFLEFFLQFGKMVRYPGIPFASLFGAAGVAGGIMRPARRVQFTEFLVITNDIGRDPADQNDGSVRLCQGEVLFVGAGQQIGQRNCLERVHRVTPRAATRCR